MQIRAGYEIAYELTQPTAMIFLLTVHPSRHKDLLSGHKINISPSIEAQDYRDCFGNVCTRVLASAGRLKINNSFPIKDDGRPDMCAPHAARRRVIPCEPRGSMQATRDHIISHWPMAFRMVRGQRAPCASFVRNATRTSNMVCDRMSVPHSLARPKPRHCPVAGSLLLRSDLHLRRAVWIELVLRHRLSKMGIFKIVRQQIRFAFCNPGAVKTRLQASGSLSA